MAPVPPSLLLLPLLFLLLLSLPPLPCEEEGMDKVPVEVVAHSSPCSATCGLGVKTQRLCLMKDGENAMEEERERKKDGTELSAECRVRVVRCLESWRCGLSAMTVSSGQRVEMDCVGEVMQATGRFTWRVSWRYARGIITSDDSLFSRWDAPLLDRVIMDPVTEGDAGTYRCDVQDASYRMVKRVYWGVRVLPRDVLNLDYDSSVSQWDKLNQTLTEGHDHPHTPLIYTLLISLSLACTGAGAILLALYWTVKGRGAKNFNRII